MMKAKENCLAHALIIDVARVDNDPNYKEYLQARKLRHIVQNLAEKIGIDLANGAGIPELVSFRERFRYYKIFFVLRFELLKPNV